MRILYITTVGGTMRFFKSFIYKLINEGHTVDIATNMLLRSVPDCYKEWKCNLYQISCTRSPLNIGNIKAIKEIKSLVLKNHYDIVHCHTPIAAACTRLACTNLRKNGTRVVYTAHGFHFYKGAPLKNWLLYYSVEKICSYFTDVLITINKDDFDFAKKKFTIQNIQYIPGVGIDVNRFANAIINIKKKREEIGVSDNAIMLLSVGELNKNKNHQIVLKAMACLNDQRIHYVIAGKGKQKEELLLLADKLGLTERLHLLGYRSDVEELDKAADIFLLPSIREGLNVSVMEAMASGLPCIVSDIRGNRDLIDQGKGGYLVDPLDEKAFAKRIEDVQKKDFDFGKYNANKAKMYTNDIIINRIMQIYVSNNN